jgi:hypothetical protein
MELQSITNAPVITSSTIGCAAILALVLRIIRRNLKFSIVLVSIVKNSDTALLVFRCNLFGKFVGTITYRYVPVSGKNLPPTRIRSANCRTRSRSTLRPPVLIPIPRHFFLPALNAATFYTVQALLPTPPRWKTSYKRTLRNISMS